MSARQSLSQGHFQSPSQTIGPFFHYGLNPVEANYPHTQIANHCLVSEQTQGERLSLTGRVFDGKGVVVEDALVEIWQANAAGRYRHPNDARSQRALDPHFQGFGRCGTGASDDGRFVFKTIKPGPDQPGNAPFISVTVFMRGLLNHVYTRVYFDDEVDANATDPVLSRTEAGRKVTLLAKCCNTPDGLEYTFDIHMQGEQETVFFDL
jgi:protocatechuate 3,4-dioxygenase alpha subunit